MILCEAPCLCGEPTLTGITTETLNSTEEAQRVVNRMLPDKNVSVCDQIKILSDFKNRERGFDTREASYQHTI